MSITGLDVYGSGKGLGALPNITAHAPLGAPAGRDEAGSSAVTERQMIRKADLEAAVKKLNEQVAPALQSIEFSMDQETDRIVVKVVDTATQKVLRQIPNEEVLAFSRNMDKLQGLVIRQTA